MALTHWQLGEKTFRVVEFGTGDIAMCFGRHPEIQPNYNTMVYFCQDVPKPVEDWENKPFVEPDPEAMAALKAQGYDFGDDMDSSSNKLDESKTILFQFNRKRSVLAVIRTLQELADQMPEDEW